MKNLKAKLNKQGGFTLIEMLIVVAIIAILIAVSIPLVNSSLERARESTDAANERSFKAVLTVSYTNGKYEVNGAAAKDFDVGTTYVYDAANGTLATAVGTTSNAIKAYGKSTKVQGVDAGVRKGKYLWGKIDDKGIVSMVWGSNNKPTSFTATGTTTVDLISPKMVADV